MGSKQIDIPPAIADLLFVSASHARGRWNNSSNQTEKGQ